MALNKPKREEGALEAVAEARGKREEGVDGYVRQGRRRILASSRSLLRLCVGVGCSPEWIVAGQELLR